MEVQQDKEETGINLVSGEKVYEVSSALINVQD